METAASLVVMLPLLVMIMFVVLEASHAYLIKESLAQGAREAARALAIAYGQNSQIANNRPLEDAQVLSGITIPNIINASAQFSDPVWTTTGSLPEVMVTVTYTSNQNGLPPFPNPDPLHLGSNFTLNATSTYRLE
jgi:Flp pilus assembly protein TadG